MGIKNFFSNLFTRIFKKKMVQVIITPEMELNEAMEKERGYLSAKLASKEVENIKLKEQIEELKPIVNIAQELTEKKEELMQEPYIGAFSWGKFFEYRNKGQKWKKFKVLSYDLRKDFGYFHDILTIPDGRTTLIIKNYDGEIQPLITARTSRELFMNFKGMVNSVGKGYFIVNLDSEGNYFENTFEREIPDIITDAQGKFVFTKTTYPFSEILVKNLSDLNKAYEEIETYEEMAREQLRKERLLYLQKKFAEQRAAIVEASEGKNFRQVIEIYKQMSELVKDNLLYGENKAIDKEIVDRLDTARTEVSQKLEEEQTKSSREAAKNVVRDGIDWALSLERGEKIEKEEEEIPQEELIREQKYQEMKTKMQKKK